VASARTDPTTAPPPAVTWAPCPTCWGQRRIWIRGEAPNGEGAVLTPVACYGCMGIGEVAA
jgi:hypothetical protein